MRTSHVACVLVVVLVAFGLFVTTSHAQSTNASVGGQITDEQGRVVLSVTVVLTNLNTGVTYEAKTNGDGIYSAPNVPPGIYRANVTKDGFKSIVKGDIELHVQDVASINFQLQVGSVNETVTVEAGGLVINTTDASVSTVVDQTYVKNMPLNGRSFQDLILLTPGVATQSPQQQGGFKGVGQSGEFSVNGQRTESNYYTVDGVSANVGTAAGFSQIQSTGPSGSLAASTALGTTQALVSVDALQEFRVQSSTYSAEYGRNPGGQFAFETKSGTNQWHGTAYDYLRNGFFDAQDWFNDYFGKPEPALRQNDFGGTIGGPVQIPRLYNGKDKTFFFVSYEGLRLTSPQAAAVSQVPDSTLRANTPSPLNQVLNAFPVQSPTGIDDTANGTAQYIGSWSSPASINSTSVRLDDVVNDKLRLFFRFSDTSSNSTARGGTQSISPSIARRGATTLRTYTAGASTVFSIRLSNEFRVNYSSNHVAQDSSIDALGGSTPIDLVKLSQLGSGADPNVFFFLGPDFFFLVQSTTAGAQRQWNFVDTASLSLGRHQFKFGADYRRLAPFAIPPNYNPQWYFGFFNGIADVETNNAFFGPQAQALAYPLYTNFAAFAQDEWKVSPHLSLTMGLRWEVNPAPGVTQGLKPYTIQGSGPDTWTLAPQGTQLWQTTWYNFAPRLGAAYVIRSAPGWETVLRGGGGVFFDTGQQLGSLGFQGPGFLASGSFAPMSFPGNAAALIPPIVNPPVGKQQGVFAFPPHLQLPYTLQWNTSIEQALGKTQALTISYVGSHAARLLQENLFHSSTNALISNFFIVENGLTSDYNSLQLQYRRRLSRGVTALMSYTWSHCLDYGSLNLTIGYQRGNCDFDLRHSYSAALSYNLPNVGHGEFASFALHGWGLDDRFSARTAFPVSINGNTVFDSMTGKQMDAGADLVSGQPVYLYGANCDSTLQGLGDLKSGQGCPGGRAINPCAFFSVGGPANHGCPANPTILGLAPRNFTRGFDAVQMDLAVRREFPIYENLKLQFRAEAFNIFNHPNFGTISTAGLNFGQAAATLANSLAVLSPLYQQGGSRSMQFALKFIF